MPAKKDTGLLNTETQRCTYTRLQVYLRTQKMNGKVKLLAVVSFIVAAAAQDSANEMLGRTRRQTPPLPAALPPLPAALPPVAAPRPAPVPNLWSCCPRMPAVLKPVSRAGCLFRPALPISGGAMPMAPPAGGPIPVPGGVPMPGGAPLPGAVPMPGGATPSIPPLQRSNPGNYSCFIECAYKNQTLVSGGGALLVEAVKARVDEMVIAYPVWADVLKAAALACTLIAPKVESYAPCKSGAAEINSCINNYVLKNCPASVKVDSLKCTELRNNVKIPQWG